MLWTLCLYVVLPTVVVLVAYTLYMSRKHGSLQRLGIPGPKPCPIFGTIIQDAKVGYFKNHVNLYRKYKDQKAYCGYIGPLPIISPCDLDIINDIGIKHFNIFRNRIPRDVGEPFNHSMLNLKDEHWKMVRALITPSFTSGKLKRMVSLVQDITPNLVQYLKENQECNVEIELKSCMSKCTLDSIASTAFGVSINSFTDKDNEFNKQATRIFSGFNTIVVISLLADFLWPVLKRVTTLVPTEAINFFKTFIDDTLENRIEGQEGRHSKRHDFIQQAMESLSEGQEAGTGTRKLTRTEIEGNALSFIGAGTDSVAAVMAYFLFLMANNSDCCRKVQEEIDEVLQGEAPDYENVQKLIYLDMCLNETMRMYPPGFAIDRVCCEDIEIRGVMFPKDSIIFFPVCGIHYDPDIYPEPEKFDPERFTAEEKASRHPMAHMPFGVGPRNCIGMRLALLTMKLGLVAVLQTMTPVTCSKTVYPPRIQTFAIDAVDGLWVKMELKKK